MAISNTQLLTNKEPDKYKGYTDRERQAAQEFEHWDRGDLDRYIHNKNYYEIGGNSDGRTQADIAAENQAFRAKYNLTEDKYSYGDLGRLGADLVFGQFVNHGLNSDDPRKREAAKDIGSNWYDYMASDDDYYYGGGRGGGGGGYGGGGGFQMPPMPTMRSGKSMAELLGVIYDYDRIHGDWSDAVEKKYSNLDNEFGRTQDGYYDSVANNADMLMGAMRRGDRDAVISGTAQGTQAAQEMSALLGVSADAAQGATELAHGRSDLVNQRETELANVTKDAMKYYNELGINLGQLSASELNALTQAYAAQVATLGGVYNTDVLADVERERIASTERISTADNFSREQIAQWGHASNEEIAKANNLTAKEVEDIRGANNLAVAKEQLKNNSIPKYGGGTQAAGSSSYPSKNDELSAYEKLASLHGIYQDAIASGDVGLANNALKGIESLMGRQLRSDSELDPESKNLPAPDKVKTEIRNSATPAQKNSPYLGVPGDSSGLL